MHSQNNERSVTGSEAQWTSAQINLMRSRTEASSRARDYCIRKSDSTDVLRKTEPRRSGKQNADRGVKLEQAKATQGSFTQLEYDSNATSQYVGNSGYVTQNVGNGRSTELDEEVQDKAVEPISFTVIDTCSLYSKNVSVCSSLDRLRAASHHHTHSLNLLRGCPLHDHTSGGSGRSTSTSVANELVASELTQWPTLNKVPESEAQSNQLPSNFQCFIGQKNCPLSKNFWHHL